MVIITDESSQPCKYHVFLSFRGDDTRNNFTGHLYKALREKGIVTFMDDKLNRGDDISTSLIKAIKDSKVSIVVFSENYASSKWCLEELVNIVDCSECNQQNIVPVFYKVDPSDVRNQRGSFAEGLAKHEGKWKNALTKVANLSGFHLLDNGCSESNIIGEIVEDISNKVDHVTELDVGEYQVGMERRVQTVQVLLRLQVKDVHIVGIWGPGGIGKTTIAKEVFNSIAHKFDGSCFLEDIREISQSTRGIVKLQKILLREILKENKLNVTNVARGISMIKEKLQGKSVLLVLDDISEMKQLNNLACQCSWFGMGSRIIITTRDKQLLRCHGVHPNLIYEVPELDNHEALELFCVKTFKRIHPLVDYAELTKRAIRYSHGLPLALTILGSSLRGGNIEQWEAILDGSENHHIKDVLKYSYDGLDQCVKEAFLDIACFFKGESKEHVTKLLEACGSNRYVIGMLIEKALIRIHWNGSIWMHDLVQEMGRDIVHEQSPYDPGKRSRLWFHEDVYRVLNEIIGTNNVRGIKVELPEDSDVVCLCATTFSSMKNLKLLIHRAGCYSGVVDSLPNSLRVIDWPNCPLQLFPSNNIPRELSLIHMPQSRITKIGDGFKRLINLTTINLRGCEYLTKVLDLSGTPNLQRLDLNSCPNLVEVHTSVGLLENLDYLDLCYCTTLETFPMKVSWKSMREFWVQRCSRLENFINIADNMPSIKTLDLSGSGIKELHSWIGCCTSLEYLYLLDTGIKHLPSTLKNLTCLVRLNLNNSPFNELPSEIGCLSSLLSLHACGSLIEELPPTICNLTSLEELHLSQSLIKQLPSSIGNLTSLVVLKLSGTLIKELPSSIGDLTSLKTLELSQTLIKELPSSICNLSSLEVLLASKSLIEKLPPMRFGSLMSLEVLDVSGTPLRELPSSIDCLASFEGLEASATLIEELPLSIGNLIYLGNLILRGCVNLKNVPHSVYGGLPLLHKLDLSWCPKLVTFPSRAESSNYLESQLSVDSINGHVCHFLFPKLRRLYFEGCNLSAMSDFLTNLDCKSTLFELDLSGSNIDSLPACIKEFCRLSELQLHDCKMLRDISELPPNLAIINLDGCELLERFSKLSDILDQRDTPGNLQIMTLSQCNKLMDNLGTNMVSEIAKSLPYQLAQASSDQHVLFWTLQLPSLLDMEIEVPEWFYRGEVTEVETSVHEIDDDCCLILVEVPENLKAHETGLSLCLIFEITENIDNGFEDYVARLWIDGKEYENDHYLEAKATGSGNVLVHLIYISFKELKMVDHVAEVICYLGNILDLRSVGVHLANNPDMQETDGEHMQESGEYVVRKGNKEVLDDSFITEGNDDCHPAKRCRWQ